MRTALISDLHLGAVGGADVARRPEAVERLVEALAPAERIVLLGDLLEMRERSVADLLDVTRPFFDRLAEAAASQPRSARRRERVAGRGRGAGRAGRMDRLAALRGGGDDRLSRAPPAPRRVRRPRALPGPAPHRAAARVDRGVGDGPGDGAWPQRRLRRRLRGRAGAAVRVLRR